MCLVLSCLAESCRKVQTGQILWSFLTLGERWAPQGLGGEGAPDGLLFSMLLLLLQQILCPTLYNHSPISFFFFKLLSIWTRLYNPHQVGPLPWAKKVTLLLAEPDLPYCDGENWLEPIPRAQIVDVMKLIELKVNDKSNAKSSNFLTQSMSRAHTFGQDL